ncbi:MAG: T9SS type A sorting domain-containing protein [Bacteroidia bacterium]|nr:T9SS type A sorting domain-containing protein [Bacteroidia bacterium]MBS1764503.1 T9SS type A sorting domain-containing protein [Bacteroidota bacterium]
MPFAKSTQATISDQNGSFLMSSNGVWIADATNDTMQNGSGLNPNSFTSSDPDGLSLPNGNIILPMPDDSNKYVLFHQTGNYSVPVLSSTEIYFSVIDITKNGGLGKVISKNNVITTGLFGWGLSACKHGNGRDWWVVAMNEYGDTINKILLTHDTIQYIGKQYLSVPAYLGFANQLNFSPDGEKFAYIHGTPYPNPPTQYITNMRYFEFDRCSGTFSNPVVVNIPDSTVAFANAFSPNSKLLYVASVWNIYQFNTDSAYINPHLINVAVNDSFADPFPPVYATFDLAYLGANGKIYLTTGNTTHYIHAIENPDNIGMACNVQQHSVLLPCYHGQAVPNHPNYYLGRKIGSPCDSLTSVAEIEHDFKFKIFPNPNNGNFRIMYLLPQNKSGKLEIFDINGRVVYSQNLPPWSTLQSVSLPRVANGVYNCSITSNNQRVNKKLVVIR